MHQLVVSSLQRRKLLRWSIKTCAAVFCILFVEKIAWAFFLALVAGAKGVGVCQEVCGGQWAVLLQFS